MERCPGGHPLVIYPEEMRQKTALTSFSSVLFLVPYLSIHFASSLLSVLCRGNGNWVTLFLVVSL